MTVLLPMLLVLMSITAISLGWRLRGRYSVVGDRMGKRRQYVVHLPGVDCVSEREYERVIYQRDELSVRVTALQQALSPTKRPAEGSLLSTVNDYRSSPLSSLTEQFLVQSGRYGFPYLYGSSGAIETEYYDMTEEATFRKTLRYNHNERGEGWQTHAITSGQVINYLVDNPTLDESKEPMNFNPYGDCRQGTDVTKFRIKAKPGKFNSYDSVDWDKMQKASIEQHKVPFDKLREYIEQHPVLSMMFKEPPKAKTVKVIVERPLGLSDAEQAEMTIALQRQQHIRNEYLRRAYVEGEKSKALDEQMKGMTTLRSLMERLEIPMADWMSNELALAQLPLIEGKEVTNDLHVRVSGSDGGGGLESGGNPTPRSRGRTRKTQG